LAELSNNRDKWERMSARAIEAAGYYSIEHSATRFAELLESIRDADRAPPDRTPAPPRANPFHMDYADIFAGHPTVFWAQESVALTAAGRIFLDAPRADRVPQLHLMGGAVGVDQLAETLRGVATDGRVAALLASGIEPITLSIALKNALITVRRPDQERP
jgi:hypothetical protein